MHKTDRKKVFYYCTFYILVIFSCIISIGLYTFRDLVSFPALVWLTTLLIDIIILMVAVLYAYDARTYGKTKKHIRMS